MRRRAGRRRARTAGWLLALFAGFTVIAMPVASAHNVLVSTTPADRSHVSVVPGQVVLTFDAPAQAIGTTVVVTGPGGPVQVGSPRLVDTTVAQSLGPGSPAGAYAVAWKVTSADGHPVTGSFTFTAAAASSGGRVTPSASASTAKPSTGSGSVTLLVGILIVVLALGAAAYLARRRRPAPSDDGADRAAD